MINIQNKDNECFRWCLSPGNRNLSNIRNVDRDFAKQLKLKDIKSPDHKKYYAQTEEQKQISFFSVFGC